MGGDGACANARSRHRQLHHQAKPSDTCCIIQPGEHPFTEHETVVEYRRAKMVAEDLLETSRTAGFIRMQDSVNEGLLRRIQEGALASIYAAKKIQDAVRAALGF